MSAWFTPMDSHVLTHSVGCFSVSVSGKAKKGDPFHAKDTSKASGLSRTQFCKVHTAYTPVTPHSRKYDMPFLPNLEKIKKKDTSFKNEVPRL